LDRDGRPGPGCRVRFVWIRHQAASGNGFVALGWVVVTGQWCELLLQDILRARVQAGWCGRRPWTMCASPARNWTDDDGNIWRAWTIRVTERRGASPAKSVRDGMICRRRRVHTNKGVCSGGIPGGSALPGLERAGAPKRQHASKPASAAARRRGPCRDGRGHGHAGKGARACWLLSMSVERRASSLQPEGTCCCSIRYRGRQTQAAWVLWANAAAEPASQHELEGCAWGYSWVCQRRSVRSGLSGQRANQAEL
jgi:hypothetical protein